MATKAAQSPQEKTVAKSRDKAQKFVDLAQKRVQRALSAIESVKALSSRRSYTYTPDQVTKIGVAFQASLKSCMDAFTGAQVDKETFKL